MKFKAPIEVESSLVDSSNSSGSAGQVLTSTGVGVDWINPTLLPAESAEKVIQTVRLGEAVSKGDPLVITGYHGSNGPAIVERADATDATKMPAYGVALEDYANNATGLMIAVGDFNDFDTSSYNVGDTLYVAVGGGMTNVKPTGTALIQNMGIVSRKNANNGDVEIVAIGRTNDVPNLPTGRLFVGTAANTSLASDVIYVDDTNDRVGIGTTSPGGDLHVVGASGNSGRIYLSDKDNGVGGGQALLITKTGVNSYIYNRDSGDLRLGTDDQFSYVTIKPSGFVGIGTASPSTVLEVSSTGVNGVDISQSASNASQSGRLFFTTNTASEGFALFNSNGTFQVNSGGIPNNTSGTNRISIIGSSGNVGIGTTSPSCELQVGNYGGAETPEIRVGGGTSSQIQLNTSNFSGAFAQVGFGGTQYASSNTAGKIKYTHTSQTIPPLDVMSFRVNYSDRMVINGSGNVGIGTTSPNSKLEVGGEIDTSGGDGYKINGKPWAYESSNILRLGDWEGEGFSTSIYDDNSAVTVIVKDYGAMINCSDLSSSYGSKASLAVGTVGNESAGAAVITLSNSDTTATAGDKTGTIQFAIKADNGAGSLGYTSAAIEGSIFANAGFGNAGGGILDFKTSNNSAGNSPQTRMRINQLGQVGIGTTSPSAKLDVVQSTAANGAAALHLIGPNTNPGLTSSVLIIEQGDGKKITMDGNDIDVSSGDLFINDYSGEDVTFGGQIKVKGLGSPVGDSYIANGNFGVGTTSPSSKLQVDGGVQLANDTASPSALKVGTFRYRTSGNNSYVDMCMQTGASTYAWVNIVTNNW